MNILVNDEFVVGDLMGHFMHLDWLHLLLSPDCGIIAVSLGYCQSRHWLGLPAELPNSSLYLLPPKHCQLPDHFAFLLHFWAISNSEGWAS